jgi:hypothetical protein
MSPSRGRKKFVSANRRAEVYTAVAVSVAIVLGTVLLIWLIRPGSPGVPGEGGLMARQPRMTLLVFVTLAAIAGWVFFILRRRHPPKMGTNLAVGLGTAGIIVVAIVAGIFWPGDVVRHWPKRPTTQVPVITPTSVPSTSVTTSSPTTTPTTTPAATTPTTKAR